jgi:two-component system, LytTR family, response regulator
MLKIAIIEDEDKAVRLLTTIIEEYCHDVQICGSAQDTASGMSLLMRTQPDLIFVDVHLGSETIFELLDNIEYSRYRIIFTTAHADYALQAFRYEAVDYLLKPYNPKDIIKVVERIRSELKPRAWQPQPPVESTTTKIKLNTYEGINFVDPANIVYCSADSSYCKVHIKDESSIMVSKTLGDIESLLDPTQFIRVHASYLINIHHTKRFIKDDGGMLQMSNGAMIPVSRRKRQEFLDKVR